MPRRVDASQLVGSAEIAKRLGAKRLQHVHWWRQHDPTFPEPVATIGSGSARVYVWYWPDIERWAKKNGRLSR